MLSYERQNNMKIKRILCLLLAMTCIFALISCGGPSADEFIKIADSSSPTKIITQTSVNDGDETLTGRFETSVSDLGYTMVYEYQRYATVEEGVAADDPEGFIKTVSGTVYYKDGSYSTDGENWTTDIPDASTLQVKFKLSEKNLGKFSVSDDGRTLTTTVTSAQAAKMLGIDVAATEDGVAITIVTDGQYLRRISVYYATENSENVSIETSYSYESTVTSDDDGAED